VDLQAAALQSRQPRQRLQRGDQRPGSPRMGSEAKTQFDHALDKRKPRASRVKTQF
jgi:hypothetical protein